MIDKVSLAVGALLLVTAVLASEAVAESSLEVKNLSVEFLPDVRVRVRGQLRCNGLKPSGMRHASSHIDVNLDFPRGARGFDLLPERWVGREIDADWRADGYDVGFKPYYRYKGASYREGQRKAVFYNSTYLLRPAVIDRELDNSKDEGHWIAFDKILVFKSLKAVTRARYRVVVGWKLSHRDGHFRHAYGWVVYGPFGWDVAPPCRRTLRATFRRSVSFTTAGVRVEERASDDSVGAGAGSRMKSGDGRKKRPKPARTGKRPSQLAAANASGKLATILMAFAEVENAGARANPFVGRIDIRSLPNLAGEARTKLVARVAVEGAYSFPWVKTLEVVLGTGEASVSVTVPWEAAARYAADESTLLAFYKTWKIKGGALPAPK